MSIEEPRGIASIVMGCLAWVKRIRRSQREPVTFGGCCNQQLLVDVGRGAKNSFLAFEWGLVFLKPQEAKCKMFPNNNHELRRVSTVEK